MVETRSAAIGRQAAGDARAGEAGSPDHHGAASGPEVITLRSHAELESAAELLWQVWDARTDAERNELISISVLRALAHSGNHVAGAYLDGRLVGCTVGVFGARGDRVDHLHSHITGVRQPERNRGTGLALKQHQRLWALEKGIDIVTWTFDPLVARNAYFNLCKLGASVTGFEADFYGRIEDGTNAGDHTDRLLVEWSLRSEWVEQAMTAEPGRRRHATVVPGAELIAVPEEISMLREADPRQALRERLAVRDRFRSLLTDGYRVAGMSRAREYVLLPAETSATYES